MVWGEGDNACTPGTADNPATTEDNEECYPEFDYTDRFDTQTGSFRFDASDWKR